MIGASQSGLLTQNATASSGHQYWRILTNSTSYTSSWDSHYSISFFSASDASGVDQCIGKTASASSVYSAGFEANLANDGSDSTRWANNNILPAWWSVDMVSPVEIHSVKLFGFYSAIGYFNRGYDLQWSNDGIAWITQSSFATANVNGVQTFNNL